MDFEPRNQNLNKLLLSFCLLFFFDKYFMYLFYQISELKILVRTFKNIKNYESNKIKTFGQFLRSNE